MTAAVVVSQLAKVCRHLPQSDVTDGKKANTYI
jgi:hypothetical protein